MTLRPMARHADPRRVEAEVGEARARGEPDHAAADVHARHLLGHGVLDLEVGVGRIVASEIEVPDNYVNDSGMK